MRDKKKRNGKRAKCAFNTRRRAQVKAAIAIDPRSAGFCSLGWPILIDLGSGLCEGKGEIESCISYELDCWLEFGNRESIPTVTRRLESTVNATKKSGLQVSRCGLEMRKEGRDEQDNFSGLSVGLGSGWTSKRRENKKKKKKLSASNGGRQRRKEK